MPSTLITVRETFGVLSLCGLLTMLAPLVLSLGLMRPSEPKLDEKQSKVKVTDHGKAKHKVR